MNLLKDGQTTCTPLSSHLYCKCGFLSNNAEIRQFKIPPIASFVIPLMRYTAVRHSPNCFKLLTTRRLQFYYLPYIAENFGSRKLWQIWRFATDPPKFYLPTISILAILLCKVANPSMFCLPNTYWQQSAKIFYHQSFVLYNI